MSAVIVVLSGCAAFIALIALVAVPTWGAFALLAFFGIVWLLSLIVALA